MPGLNREGSDLLAADVKEFKGIGVKDDLRVTLTPAGTAKAGPLLNGIEIIAED